MSPPIHFPSDDLIQSMGKVQGLGRDVSVERYKPGIKKTQLCVVEENHMDYNFLQRAIIKPHEPV